MMLKFSCLIVVFLIFQFCAAGDNQPSAPIHKRKLYNSPNAPIIRGSYSHAAMYENRFVYTSGLRGLDPKTDKIPDNIDDEISQALKNVWTVLSELKVKKENIVHMTNYLKNISHLPNLNKGYEKFFQGQYPARATFEVSNLPPIGNLTIHAIAIK